MASNFSRHTEAFIYYVHYTSLHHYACTAINNYRRYQQLASTFVFHTFILTGIHLCYIPKHILHCPSNCIYCHFNHPGWQPEPQWSFQATCSMLGIWGGRGCIWWTRGVGEQKPITCSSRMWNTARKGASAESRLHKGAEKRALWFFSWMVSGPFCSSEKVLTHHIQYIMHHNVTVFFIKLYALKFYIDPYLHSASSSRQ